MAVVYQAQHAELGSLHAIKRLKIPSRQVQERLVQEGRLQSSLQHPNVLSVTDLLTVDGAPALVMGLLQAHSGGLDGRSATHHQSTGCIGPRLAERRGGCPCTWAGAPIKPANILVAVTDDSLVPKVADFGLAKIMEGDDPRRP